MSLKQGQIIDGRFVVEALLARGGMGAVYRAQQLHLQRPVAIKVLLPGQEPNFRTRFLLEARSAARIKHPNAITIYDQGEDGDVAFIAMELLDGVTLSHAMGRNPLPVERAIHIARQIAGPLAQAHELGIVHRDLKPANIMLIETSIDSEFVKVLDFGLVKDIHDPIQLTEPGMFMGSARYIAPEQVKGQDVGPWTDIYSLGVILHEMITGLNPFARSTDMETVLAHFNPIRPQLPAHIPHGLRMVCERSMALDPRERPGSMSEVIQALDRCKQDRTPSRVRIRQLPHPAPVPRITPWYGRPIDLLFFLLGLMSLIAALVFAFWRFPP